MESDVDRSGYNHCGSMEPETRSDETSHHIQCFKRKLTLPYNIIAYAKTRKRINQGLIFKRASMSRLLCSATEPQTVYTIRNIPAAITNAKFVESHSMANARLYERSATTSKSVPRSLLEIIESGGRHFDSVSFSSSIPSSPSGTLMNDFLSAVLMYKPVPGFSSTLVICSRCISTSGNLPCLLTTESELTSN